MSSISVSEQNIRKIRREIEEEISYNQKLITRHEETIQRLRTGKHPFPVGQKIDNTKKEIVIIKEKLENLNNKLNDLNLGKLDEQIKEQITENMKNIKYKGETTKKRKQEQNDMMKSKKSTKTTKTTKINSSGIKNDDKSPNKSSITNVKPKSPQKNHYRNYHNNQNNERQMSYDYDRYMNICLSMPDYMIDKLNNMENNMGYIWKDIWCFGSKPIKNTRHQDNITLFEKKNGIQYVHFYDSTTYKLYEKDNRGNKKLILSRPRK